MPNYWQDHVYYRSTDPEKTAHEFFERMFNAKITDIRHSAPGRVTVEMDLNGERILIADPDTRRPPTARPRDPWGEYGLEHFGIRTDDIEAAVADLKAKGAQFEKEIHEYRPGLWTCQIYGPEQILIELVERRG